MEIFKLVFERAGYLLNVILEPSGLRVGLMVRGLPNWRPELEEEDLGKYMGRINLYKVGIILEFIIGIEGS